MTKTLSWRLQTYESYRHTFTLILAHMMEVMRPEPDPNPDLNPDLHPDQNPDLNPDLNPDQNPDQMGLQDLDC
ncbi:hypothetical protein EYF80_044853 [Liparis tanakae]|uniref:Uncharacterized protein n=1 Tax=Liparis tanakae TaxID=230148 RepID=A0A4Z2FUL2_9TELE|nr:hypothetical protein EYF80_044853 [Liparis tanakae]